MEKKQIKQFYRSYSKAMGVRVIDKTIIGALVRKVASLIPERFANYVPELADELKPCALKNIILMPFKIGDKSVSWQWQIEVLVHEAEHSQQIRKFIKGGGNVVKWYREYYDPFETEFRALQESGANAAAGEVNFAIDGRPPKPPNLDFYHVSVDAQRMCNERYKMHIDAVKTRGRCSASFKSSAAAIKILREMGVIKS
jgi:hypothetical protein